jgi:hypothetical protein
MKKYTVFIDSIKTQIEESDFENYNVLVNRCNGFSHNFQAIEKFDKYKHFYSERCVFSDRIFNYVPTHLTTKDVTNFVVGSSTVTFS